MQTSVAKIYESMIITFNDNQTSQVDILAALFDMFECLDDDLIIGALPITIKLLNSIHADIRDAAILCISSIVARKQENCDIVLNNEWCIVPVIIELLANRSANAVHCLYKLCINGVNFDKFGSTLPYVVSIIRAGRNNSKILLYACKVIERFVESSHIQQVIDSGVIPYLTQFFSNESSCIINTSIKSITKIVVSDDLAHTQHVLESNNFIDRLKTLLITSHDESALTSACRITSRIAVVNSEVIFMFFFII